MTDSTDPTEPVQPTTPPTDRILTARCHCNAFHLTHALPPSTLPQPHTYCHCTSCRRRTGHLAVLPVTLPSYAPTPDALAVLGEYTTHRGVNPVSTYWCRTCGCNVLIRVISTSTGRPKWSVLIGAVDDPKGLVKIVGHSWVGDTMDGGSTEMMRNDGLPRYHQEDGDVFHPTDRPSPSRSLSVSDRSSRLHIHCACSTFSAYLVRPNPPLPLSPSAYWYRPPLDDDGRPTRFVASWCACDSCRTTTGSSMPAFPWLTVPFVDLMVVDALPVVSSSSSEVEHEDVKLIPFADIISTRRRGQPIPTSSSSSSSPSCEPVLGGSHVIPGTTSYSSSTGVTRYFCTTCGATLAYYSTVRPWLVDIAVGLVDCAEGALCRGWMEWEVGQTRKAVVEFEEDGMRRDGERVRVFREGLEDWATRNGVGHCSLL